MLSSIVRTSQESDAVLVVGSADYEYLRGYAKKIDLVFDVSIVNVEIPFDINPEELGARIASSAVDTAVLRARRNGVHDSDIMRYIVLPHIILQGIRQSNPNQNSAQNSGAESDQAATPQDTLQQIFESLPLEFRVLPRVEQKPIRSRTTGHAPAKQGRVSRSAERSRVRATNRGRFSLYHTMMAAAPYQTVRRQNESSAKALYLEADDIRRYPFKSTSRTLNIVIIDSSGSMAASSRIRFAKGLVDSLLRQSYRHRNEVAIIIARGLSAQIALPPTRSVARAHAVLRSLPTGGATPLIPALEQALVVASEHTKRNGSSETRTIIVTDGKGNIGSDGARLNTLAHVFHQQGIQVEIVDLIRKSEQAQRFAETLGARYAFYGRGEASSYLA
ncbi:MAG: VWA domain-containing protein [Bacteroidetes bacterium]|nr:VWA domain-containing protein [Bacteroidota bacterium]